MAHTECVLVDDTRQVVLVKSVMATHRVTAVYTNNNISLHRFPYELTSLRHYASHWGICTLQSRSYLMPKQLFDLRISTQAFTCSRTAHDA